MLREFHEHRVVRSIGGHVSLKLRPVRLDCVCQAHVRRGGELQETHLDRGRRIGRNIDIAEAPFITAHRRQLIGSDLGCLDPGHLTQGIRAIAGALTGLPVIVEVTGIVNVIPDFRYRRVGTDNATVFIL